MVEEDQRGDTTIKEGIGVKEVTEAVIEAVIEAIEVLIEVRDKIDEVEEEIEDLEEIAEVSVAAERKVSRSSRLSEETSKSIQILISESIIKTIPNSTRTLFAEKSHLMSSKFISSLITTENPEMRLMLELMKIRRRKKNSSNQIGLLH